MASESILKEVVARCQAAVHDGVRANAEFGIAKVRTYDIGVLFETIKRYGGRRDWRPTDENIARLPGPVRRYVRQLEAEIVRLQRELADVRRRR